MKEKKVTAIIAAAGCGLRSGLEENKIFARIHGEPMILKTVKAFDSVKTIDEIVIVHAAGEKDDIKKILDGETEKPVKYVEGGNTRFLSVKNALFTISDGVVAVHDGARPFVSPETIGECVKSALTYGSGVAVTPLTDTVAETDGKGNVIASARKNRFAAATPQAFDAESLKRAYALAGDGEDFTDDAGVYCAFIGKCKLVLCGEKNTKLTYPEDFENAAENPLKRQTFFTKNDLNDSVAAGTGFDLHRLVKGRKLILGGVEIPSEKGLLGHSDADVLTHAVADALLSSAALRDIGYHFPDTDPLYEGVSSLKLLEKVLLLLREKGYSPISVSAVIMAQKPKLSPYISAITESLSKVLSLPYDKVGLTATTLEGLGIAGREEGIACQAFCLVRKI